MWLSISSQRWKHTSIIQWRRPNFKFRAPFKKAIIAPFSFLLLSRSLPSYLTSCLFLFLSFSVFFLLFQYKQTFSMQEVWGSAASSPPGRACAGNVSESILTSQKSHLVTWNFAFSPYKIINTIIFGPLDPRPPHCGFFWGEVSSYAIDIINDWSGCTNDYDGYDKICIRVN